jgi:hypothetical protein
MGMVYPWLQPEQLPLEQLPQELLPAGDLSEPLKTDAKTLIARSTRSDPHSGHGTVSE